MSKVLILENVLCVRIALIGIQKRGIFSGALIKKRVYCPKYVDGNSINNHFEGINFGDSDTLPFILDNNRFRVIVMK